MDYVNRLPALEDQPGYLLICAAQGTTPIQRGDGLAYVLPGVDDDPALPYPLAELDGDAAAFAAFRTTR